jgi:flagellar hook-associated protein 3 FlgL
VTRIPTRTAHQAMQKAMESNYARLNEAQRQIATGKRLTKISDATGDALVAGRLRNDEAMAKAYLNAADDGIAMLTMQDDALQSVSGLLARARELMIAGASAVESHNGRIAIATELEGLRDQLVALANTTHEGRSVFGGFSAAAVQNTGGSVSWVGDGNAVERRVSAELTVTVGTNGRDVFGFDAGSPAGADNVFAVLNRAAAAVRASDPAGVRGELENLSARHTDVTNALASVGGRFSQIELAMTRTEDAIVSMKTRRSQLEDVDLGAALIDMKDASAAYEATLAVVARMQRMSLLDFLR